jgi:hypothetical protein
LNLTIPFFILLSGRNGDLRLQEEAAEEGWPPFLKAKQREEVIFTFDFYLWFKFNVLELKNLRLSKQRQFGAGCYVQ